MKTLILSNSIKKQADTTIRVKSDNDIPLLGLPLAIAKSMLKYYSFYTYTNMDNNQKVLLIQV